MPTLEEEIAPPAEVEGAEQSQKTLDSKINAVFPGLVVRKDLVGAVKGNAVLPSYVLEYLLGQYAATDDEQTIQEGIESVKRIVAQHYVERSKAEQVKSNIREKGRYRIIDKVQVSLDDRQDEYKASFANLGVNGVIVDPAVIKAHPKLLVGGVWCLCDIEYEFAAGSKSVPWILGSLKPIQLSKFDFDGYIAGREQFTTDEWIDLLIQSIGFNPAYFTRRGKLFQLTRLIPFVERNYNLVELGPKGTGKSHIFSEFSPHGMLVSGGEVTVPKLFINNTTGRLGLVGYWDTVAFDEFAGKMKRPDKALVDIMKNYMANKTFSRGVETQGAEASMAFIGNTSHTVPYMLAHSDLFDELPAAYHDSAFLDRLHHYIPGWEVDVIRGEMFSNGYGFVVDYIAEVLKSMRSLDYSDKYRKWFELGQEIGVRDKDGINKTFSGLMKLIYPSGECTEAEAEELLRYAIEGRKRVKDQITRIDTTMASVPFGYNTKDGAWHPVTTAEEDEYPELYNPAKVVDTSESEPDSQPAVVHSAQGQVPPVESSQATPTPPASTAAAELFAGHKEFAEGQRNVSFGSLLVPYLVSAKQINVIDPYIRNYAQIRNFMELLEGIAAKKSPADEVFVKLTTVETPDDPELAKKQLENLWQVRKSVAILGIQLDVEFVPDRSIHDRSITADNGWKIILGRGLDIYQPVVGGSFDLGTKHQRYRQVKAFGVTYVKNDAASDSAE